MHAYPRVRLLFRCTFPGAPSLSLRAPRFPILSSLDCPWPVSLLLEDHPSGAPQCSLAHSLAMPSALVALLSPRAFDCSVLAG
jgi:hypothetical protein